MSGLYPVLTANCQEARDTLRQHMARHGLLEADGWKIYEFTRDVDGRTELVMRPIHSGLTPPEELECTCHFEESGTTTTQCND